MSLFLPFYHEINAYLHFATSLYVSSFAPIRISLFSGCAVLRILLLPVFRKKMLSGVFLFSTRDASQFDATRYPSSHSCGSANRTRSVSFMFLARFLFIVCSLFRLLLLYKGGENGNCSER